MLRGGCYCGAVKYESTGKMLRFVNCHCPDCRKFTGSAFNSVLVVEDTGFSLTSGDAHLGQFQSSPGKFRSFCTTCGCHVFSRAANRPGTVFIRAGSLDDDPGIKPQCHIWVKAKAPWHDIGDALPQYAEGLPPKPS